MAGATSVGVRDVPKLFTWGHRGLQARFATAADGTLRLVRLSTPADDGTTPAPDDPAAALPLVEVMALGHGSTWSGQRGIDTVVGSRLRYRGHESIREGRWRRLRVDLQDPTSGLSVTLRLASPDELPVVRSQVTVRNDGATPMVIQSVSSFTLGGLPSPDGLELHWARNEWLAECQWRHGPLRTQLADVNRAAHSRDSRGCLSFGSLGSWSSDGHLPMGALTDRSSGRTWLWQVESSTGWHWEIGERGETSYLALFGPDDRRHQWREHLDPGVSFTTVPATIALSTPPPKPAGAPHGSAIASVSHRAGFDDAMGQLTRYRRAVRRPHRDQHTLPVIFNDFMNTLRADPTTERVLPLVEAAARVGVEYFVMDAGWFDDDTNWWDSLGAWRPSTRRFPGGITEVFDRIKELGMVPGLWLEPEVVGVRSPIAAQLPDAAFFQRDGIRIAEHGRHHLDLRHPAAVAHLDQTIDRIVRDWGVGYLKLDYNISVAPGTDGGDRTSPGSGLLGHARAYHRWLSTVLDRHPDVVIENCASGGMRIDQALLALTQLQSTSDQQDPLRYPPIAVSASSAMLPEQAAVWAYPQPEYSDSEITFALNGALLNRIHLSGHLNRMTPAQLALVHEAIAVYRTIRDDIATAVPFWPLGLPGWTDSWLALGLRSPRACYLAVWRRDGGPTQRRLPLPEGLDDDGFRPEVMHPSRPPATLSRERDEAGVPVLDVTFVAPAPSALLIRLTPVTEPS